MSYVESGVIINKGKNKNQWVVKTKSGKIYFVESLFTLEIGEKVDFYITKEKERYGFGKVRWVVNMYYNEYQGEYQIWLVAFVKPLIKVTQKEEEIMKLYAPELYANYIELANKAEERNRRKRNAALVFEEIARLKNLIEKREVVLKNDEVRFYGNIDVSPVWYRSKEERYESADYSYETLRGKKIEAIEEEVAEKLFNRSYSEMLELFEENAISGEELIRIWEYIVKEYVLEKQIYVDVHGKEWVFERYVKKR